MGLHLGHENTPYDSSRLVLCHYLTYLLEYMKNIKESIKRRERAQELCGSTLQPRYTQKSH